MTMLPERAGQRRHPKLTHYNQLIKGAGLTGWTACHRRLTSIRERSANRILIWPRQGLQYLPVFFETSIPENSHLNTS
jgi:hypothetical protein